MKTNFAVADRVISTMDQDLVERVGLFLQLKRPELASLIISARGGEVKLRGCVGSYYLRQLAISVAKHVAGVLRVIDRIEVLEHHPLEAKATRSRVPK